VVPEEGTTSKAVLKKRTFSSKIVSVEETETGNQTGYPG